MKDIIYDNLQSLNIKLAKNKFLKACSSMPAYMPEACKSFIKMIQQCLDNIIYEIRIIVRACFAAWQRTSVLIGFDHSFCLQTCLQEKDMGKDYMQQYRYIVEHCCYNKYAQRRIINMRDLNLITLRPHNLTTLQYYPTMTLLLSRLERMNLQHRTLRCEKHCSNVDSNIGAMFSPTLQQCLDELSVQS